jgi:dTDP-4-dehydrorhamnose 3,5-epimerase
VNVVQEGLPGVFKIECEVHADARGSFMESFRSGQHVFIPELVQDNLSRSRANVLRGLHLQWPKSQGKLLQVLEGEIYDVVVDLCPNSENFRLWSGHRLAADGTQLWIPPGYAHGFCVLSDEALFSYKCSDYYDPDCELTVRWDDPALAIEWPIDAPLLSGRDATAPYLEDIDPMRLPIAD